MFLFYVVLCYLHKVFDIYEKNIQRLKTKDTLSQKIPALNETQESSTLTMANTSMLKTLIHDVELLLTHECNKHLNALNEERVAQRQRVLEEEERESTMPFKAQTWCDEKESPTTPHSQQHCTSQETSNMQTLVISSQTCITQPVKVFRCFQMNILNDSFLGIR
jgi:hypothetical protein